MRVKVSSSLPIDRYRAWQLLKETATLVYVAKGYMTYDGAEKLPRTWQVGTRVNLKPRLWGRPQGDHIVKVVEVNDLDRRIETHEYGGPITRWNHVMRIMKGDDNSCRLVDTIDIEAGWRTLAVATFAWFFYRHRHKRWQKLIAEKTNATSVH